MATFDYRNGRCRAQVRRKGYRPQGKTFNTLAQAQAWARDLEAKLDRGQEQDVAEMRKTTVLSILEKFRDEVCPDRKGCRWEVVRINFWIENASFPRQRLDQRLVNSIREYAAARVRKVSAATVNRELNLLSGIFTHARKTWGMPLTENPVHGVARPKVKTKSAGRLWTGDELEAMRATARSLGRGVDGVQLKTTWDYVLPAVELALETAMRLGEVCAVERSGIFLEQRYLELDETKNGDSRKVPLTLRAVEILKPLIAAAEAADREEILPMSKDTLGLRYRQLRKAAGIEGLRFHDARHTAATKASKRLKNVLELGAFTGHRSLQSLKRYYHADATELAKALD